MGTKTFCNCHRTNKRKRKRSTEGLYRRLPFLDKTKNNNHGTQKKHSALRPLKATERGDNGRMPYQAVLLSLRRSPNISPPYESKKDCSTYRGSRVLRFLECATFSNWFFLFDLHLFPFRPPTPCLSQLFFFFFCTAAPLLYSPLTVAWYPGTHRFTGKPLGKKAPNVCYAVSSDRFLFRSGTTKAT